MMFDRDWFTGNQRELLAALNAPVLGIPIRWALGVSQRHPICEVHTHGYHVHLGGDRYRAVYWTNPQMAQLLHERFSPIWAMAHAWDMRLANRLAPALNLGFDSYTLQPDATAGLDTRFLLNAPNYNYGVNAYLAAGEHNTVSGQNMRSLIKFSWATLPPAATNLAATLGLYCNLAASNNARTFRVYRTKRAWVEGTRNGVSDSPATGATWNRYDTTNNWQTAGGFGADDCEQTDIGSRAFTATETLNAFKDFVLTPTTLAGLDLGNGWMLKADTESDDAYYFASSDDATAANRPKLVVAYTLPGGGLLNPPFSAAFRGPFG